MKTLSFRSSVEAAKFLNQLQAGLSYKEYLNKYDFTGVTETVERTCVMEDDGKGIIVSEKMRKATEQDKKDGKKIHDNCGNKVVYYFERITSIRLKRLKS